jgi:hypothetical protein
MIRQMRRPSLEMPTPQPGCHPVKGTPSSLVLAWVIDSRNGDTLSLFEPPR